MSKICSSCIETSSLKAFINKNSSEGSCNFCNNQKSQVVAWEDIFKLIEEGIGKVFSKSTNRNSGNYIMNNEELSELGFRATTKVRTKVMKDLTGNKYSRHQDFSSESISLDVLWERLEEISKHECRFFSPQQKIYESMPSTVEIIFKQIYDLFTEYGEEVHIIKHFNPSHEIYRARVNKNIEEFNHETLGAPPKHKATVSTRMTPLGISAFYGSSSKETALKEIKTDAKDFVIGIWESNRRFRYFDFTSFNSRFPYDDDFYLKLPDCFSRKSYEKRNLILFLNQLNSKFQKETKKDGQEQLDYIPTQLISEFLKISFRDIYGIKYSSSVNNSDSNFILFKERFMFSDSDSDSDSDIEKSNGSSLKNKPVLFLTNFLLL